MEKYTDRYHPEFIPGTYSIYSSAILQQQQDRLEQQQRLIEENRKQKRPTHSYYSSQNYKFRRNSSTSSVPDATNNNNGIENNKNSPTTLNKLKTKYGVILFPQPTDSPNDPLNWSSKRKALHFICLVAITGFTAATSNSASAAADSLNEAYGISYGAMNTGAGVLFFAIGFGAWLISPLEALYGRRISILLCLISGIVGCIWFARVNDVGGAIWTQLFVGFSESCTQAQVQLSLSSIFYRHQMGAVITIYILATSIGTYLGPLISGFILEGQNYTWIGWWGAIIGFLMLVFIIFCFEEDKFNYSVYKPTYDGEKTKFYYNKKLKIFKDQIYQESISNYQMSNASSDNNGRRNSASIAYALNQSIRSQEDHPLSPTDSIIPPPTRDNKKNIPASNLIKNELKRESSFFKSPAPSKTLPPPISHLETISTIKSPPLLTRGTSKLKKAMSFTSSASSVQEQGSVQPASVATSRKLIESKAIDMINNSVPVVLYQRNNGMDDEPWNIRKRFAIFTRNSTNYENIESNEDENGNPAEKSKAKRMTFKSFKEGAKKDITKYLKLLSLNLTCLIFPSVILSGLMWGMQDAFLSFYLTTEDTIFYDPPWNYGDNKVALMNVPCLIGSLIGCLYAGSATDYFVLWMARRNGGLVESEYRLWFAFFCGIIGPIGLLMFGIGTEKHLNWRVVYVGLGFIGFAWGCSGDLAMTYLIDSYPELILETMVAVALINNCIGAIFTFVCSPWLDSMGTQNTYIVLAAIEFFIMFSSGIYIMYGKNFRRWTRKHYIRIIEARDGF